ncbi:MAG: GH3 auxin-responsive promoter family protein [Candidatus Bathyarchaeota archaeon]|nr:GH3 auxin-responsive promoter family protein [Candidatus Bathyarchaeota archaeon]
MSEDEYVDASSVLQRFVGPWYKALENPAEAQEQVLLELLGKYAQTQYGSQYHAGQTTSIREYQHNFPVADYLAYQPYLGRVQEGDYRAFLSEPPQTWVMTRGSTGKQSKVLPTTPKHLEQIFLCGARAIIHFAMRTENFEVLTGNILNLNFPSTVHTMTKGGEQVAYGYSSGTYARLNPMLSQVSLLPRQEDIDALGSGIGRADWERRFELAYQQAMEKNVVATMGVTPVVLAFAKYVQRRHGKTPADLWRFQALFCTSVAKIHSKYGPVLQKYFGKAPVVEMYTATEGVFGQQYDDLPYFTPNYDAYLFEVDMGGEFKLLHELKRGEWGRLIVSSCMFPRYDIGDMVEAAGENRFRIFGRRSAWTLLEHRLFRLFLGWLL